MKVLKGLGLGTIYVIFLPFILVGAVLAAVVGIVRWFISIPVGIVRFFKGEKFFKPLKEDLEVEQAIALHHENLVKKEAEEPAQPVQPISQATTYVQNNYYTNPNAQLGQQALPPAPNGQLSSPNYQEIPVQPYQQIAAHNEEPLFDDDRYTASSIDNPIKLPEEGGNE